MQIFIQLKLQNHTTDMKLFNFMCDGIPEERYCVVPSNLWIGIFVVAQAGPGLLCSHILWYDFFFFSVARFLDILFDIDISCTGKPRVVWSAFIAWDFTF